MKAITIRAKNVIEHKGFVIGEGCEIHVDGRQGVAGDFVVVGDDGTFLAIIEAEQLAAMFTVLQPRGRKPKAPPFASPEQPPARQVTVEEHIAAESGEGDLQPVSG